MLVQPFFTSQLLFAPDEGGGAGGESAPAEGAPTEGQGETEGSGGLYDLASVPEDVRSIVEPHLKAIEANVTKKFQANAEAMKAWEPYQELGVNDVPPEQMAQLLQFAELAQNPEQFAEWWRAVGDQMNLMPQEDHDDDLDSLFEDDDLTPEKVQELIADALAEKLDPVFENLSAADQERAEAEALAQAQQQLDEFKKDDPDLDVEAVVQLAYAYVDDDPDGALERGFKDYQRLVGKGEQGIFSSKAGAPKSPEGGGGGADHEPKKITSFEDAKVIARERMRQANQT